MNRFLLLLKTSRPIFWLVAPLVFIGGLIVGEAKFSVLSVIQLVLLSFPYSLFVFGINDIYDYASDKINSRKKFVEGIALQPRYHEFVKHSVLIAGFVLLLSSLFTLNILNIMSMILLLFLSYYYSSKPLRFKEVPLLDSITNGLGFLFVALLGFSFGSSIEQLPIKALFVAGCVSAMHALTTIVDYQVDKKAKVKTFSTVLGKRNAALFALLIFIMTIIFSNILSIIILLYLAICALSSLMIMIYPNEKFSLVVNRILFVLFLITIASYLIFRF
jgi:4-hydroxybenzoate polyprenyltransferase